MSINIQRNQKKRVVIVGGGLGGLRLAEDLYGSGMQVVLIDKNNFHQFPPLIYQIASAGIDPSSISFPFRQIFRKRKDFYFRMAEARMVDTDKKILQTSIGKIDYDYLVLAAGATTNFFGNKNIEEWAIPMKTVPEAMGLRNALLSNFERALTCATEEERQELLNIVIVGGGATGVEIAGALSEMRRYVIPYDYPDMDFSLMHIYLIEAGDRLLAGTIVGEGCLRFRAEQVGSETVLANIIRMVEEAQGSKAPVQRFVDKAALVFVPCVLLLAVLTFVVWMVVGGEAMLPQALLSAVSVLVIACPCAMGLATPTALIVGIGKAAQRGILVKDATAVEQLCRVNAVVIDKTGTLTVPNKDINFKLADDVAIDLREHLKPHAAEAVALLQERGVEVWMMSGDKEEAAAYWAGKTGIKHWKSRCMPQDKENMVRSLQSEGKCVAMVGDGINDSQALALADVSIAMGRGTDVAMDVAQVTLMGDDLRRIPEACQLSQRTVGMIRQNLFWAFIYNIVCIPLAAGLPHVFGFNIQITPMWASALMAMSSVSVVTNSLRLKYKK